VNLLKQTTSGPIRTCNLCSRFFLITALISIGEVLFSDEIMREMVVCEECAEKVSNAFTKQKEQKTTDEMCQFMGLEMLRPLYTEIHNPEEVKRFLQSNPYLMSALLEAPTQIKRFFPDETLLLEISPILDGELLTVYIQTTKSTQEANRLLGEFDDAWWLCCVSEETRDKICITLNYVP